MKLRSGPVFSPDTGGRSGDSLVGGVSLKVGDVMGTGELKAKKEVALSRLPVDVRSRITVGEGFIQIDTSRYGFVDNNKIYNQSDIPSNTLKADDFLKLKRLFDLEGDQWDIFCFDLFGLDKKLSYRTATPGTRRGYSILHNTDNGIGLGVHPMRDSDQAFPVITFFE